MTSDEKSTCPGESIKLIKNSFPGEKNKISWLNNYPRNIQQNVPTVFCLIAERSSLSTSKYMEIAVDLMVIPRSFSSSLVSVNRISPAFAEAIIPAFETRESVSVDFP